MARSGKAGANRGFTIEPMCPAGNVQGIILLKKNKFPFGIAVDSVVGVIKLGDPTLHPVLNRTQETLTKNLQRDIFKLFRQS